MTALSAGGQPRTRNGVRQSAHHARRYRVTGVPKTVVNETIEILGGLPEPDFVAQALAEFTTGN
jgi:predicted DsbA family dithiol-disulfide isomerase